MMINRNDVFQILEIEPTEDKRSIRKAYARLVKQYHPEEQPEKWKEIHDAYEAALHMAEHGIPLHGPYTTPEQPVLNEGDGPEKRPPDRPQDERREQNEQEEMNALFERVNDIASGQREQRQRQKKEAQDERIGQIIKIVTDLLEKEMFSQKTWSILLEQESIFPLLCSDEFLYAFGDCFQGKRIPAELYRYLRAQIVRIQNYDEERGMEASASLWGEWNSIEEAVGYAARKIDAAHYANIGKQEKERIKRRKREEIWLLPKVFIGFLAAMMLIGGIVVLIFFV